MLSKAEARKAILDMIIAQCPRETWEEAATGTGWAYQEAWLSTRDDPRFNKTPAHRRFRAPQERHFLMEAALANIASRCSLPYVGEVVKSNRWVYGMIRTPGLCIMQKKVQDGREPPPAEFRRQVTAANAIVRQGDFFAIDAKHTSAGQPLFGILIHTPESQDFKNNGYGRPSFVRLAFPFGDYSGWAATFTMEDLLAGYVLTKVAPAEPKAAPTWKVGHERKDQADG